jgi:thiamine pyrophosphate-dependent acetolactate synthase large subunit-like protein
LLSGEMNMTVTGFGFGMRSRRLFPEGQVLLSIPWDVLPRILKNLGEMEWVPESYTLGAEGHKKKVRRIVEELKKEE